MERRRKRNREEEEENEEEHEEQQDGDEEDKNDPAETSQPQIKRSRQAPDPLATQHPRQQPQQPQQPRQPQQLQHPHQCDGSCGGRCCTGMLYFSF